MDWISYRAIYRRNLSMAFPVIFSQVGQISVSLTDTLMVGRSGTADLAAASLANSLFLVGMLFGIGLMMGLTPLVGYNFRNGNPSVIATHLQSGLVVGLLAAVVISGGLLVVSVLFGRMGQSPDVLELAGPYLRLQIYSLVPLLLFYVFKQFLEGMGNTRIAMLITLTANLINIGLNYLLIFGKAGFPEYGLYGAGLATLTSRIAMLLLLVPFLFRHHLLAPYVRLLPGFPISRCRLHELVALGLPIGGQLVVEVLSFSVAGIMCGWLGQDYLAAHQIALNLTSFSYMVSLGIGAGTTILVSHEKGSRHWHEIRQIVYATIHLVLVFMGVMALCFVGLRHWLPSLFTPDKQVIEIASQLLIVAALFQLFDGLQVSLLSILRGLADVKIPMLLAFTAYI